MVPIVLRDPRTVLDSDEAGTIISKSVVGRPHSRAIYDGYRSDGRLSYVPTLGYYCIKSILAYPDQAYLMGSTRLRYVPNHDGFDILRALIPSWGTSEFRLTEIDPRLWVILVQIYSDLPKILWSYPISLSDRHLPLMQHVPATPDFTLITILDLRNCKELTDNTILDLKTLHGLCALDAGGTILSAYGIKALARTLVFNEQGAKRGPWALRILRLRDCKDVDGQIFHALTSFSLLCIIDLRGTACRASDVPSLFEKSRHTCFFDPISLTDAFTYLHSLHHTLFSNPQPFSLFVTYAALSSYVPKLPGINASKFVTQHSSGSFPPSYASTGYGSGSEVEKPRSIQLQSSEALRRGMEGGMRREITRKCLNNNLDYKANDSAVRDIRYQSDSDKTLTITTNRYANEGSAGRVRVKSVTEEDYSSSRKYKPPGVDDHVHDPRSSTGDNLLDLAWITQQNETAYTEMDLNKTRRSIEQFYQQPRSLARKSFEVDRRSRLLWKDSVDRDDDPTLMLYRPPPTWSVLEAVTPPVNILAKGKRLEGLKLIDRGNRKDAIQVWSTAISERRRMMLANSCLRERHKTRVHSGTVSISPSPASEEVYPESRFARDNHQMNVSESTIDVKPSTGTRTLRRISEFKPPPLHHYEAPRLRLEPTDRYTGITRQTKYAKGMDQKRMCSKRVEGLRHEEPTIEELFKSQSLPKTSSSQSEVVNKPPNRAGGQSTRKRIDGRADKRVAVKFDWKTWSR